MAAAPGAAQQPGAPAERQCAAPGARAAAASSAAPAPPQPRGGGARRARAAAAAAAGGGWRDWVLPLLALVLWFVSSSAIIVVNKRLLVDEGFAYPLTLTGLSQFVSALGGWLVAQLGWMKLGPRPSPRVFATRLLPVVAFTAGSLYFGNVAYLSLSVAFIQILKVLTPAITLTVCWAAGLERLTRPLVASVLLISAGTGAATLFETGGGGRFAWAGFGCFALSALLEALRVVYIQLLLGRFKFNTLEVLVYMSPACGALLLACAAVWERDALLPGKGLAIAARNPLGFAAALCMGFFVNLTTAYAIQMTSSLTFKVFGCIKNTVVVGLGVAMGDTVAPAQLAGYAVSVFGFALYTRAKMLEAAGAAPRAPRRAHKKAH